MVAVMMHSCCMSGIPRGRNCGRSYSASTSAGGAGSCGGPAVATRADVTGGPEVQTSVNGVSIVLYRLRGLKKLPSPCRAQSTR